MDTETAAPECYPLLCSGACVSQGGEVNDQSDEGAGKGHGRVGDRRWGTYKVCMWGCDGRW